MATACDAHDEVSENNRKSPRKRVAIPCALSLAGAVYSGKLMDISDGGVFVQTEETMDCGAILTIIFEARVKKEIIALSLKAKVVYVGRFLQGYDNFYGFGAQFEGLPPKTAERLNAVLDDLQTEPQRKYEFM
jgi:hypothetical protein